MKMKDDVKKVFEEYIPDFYIEYVKEKRQIIKKEEAASVRVRYASYLNKPVKKKTILFWARGERLTENVPREIFESAYQKYGAEYQYIWVIKGKNKFAKEMPEEVRFVEKESEEHIEALAVSEYIISGVIMPSYFLKREQQYYVNAELTNEKISQILKNGDLDNKSRIWKDMGKSDIVLWSEDEPDKRKNFISGKSFCFGRMQSDELIEQIFDAGKQEHQCDKKKQILILTSYDAEKKTDAALKNILKQINGESYDVMLATRRMDEFYLNDKFDQLDENAVKMLYRGPMTLSEEEMIYMRLIRKYPDLYRKDSRISGFVHGLMDREWKRIWGDQKIDIVIVMGKLQLHEYFWMNAVKAEHKTLINQGFMDKLYQNNPTCWQKLLEAFDDIYVPKTEAVLQRYGQDNLCRVKYLTFDEEETNMNTVDMERVKIDGIEYKVIKKWNTGQCGIKMTLVQMPEEIG